MLKLVIPKGSLEAQTLALFEAADIRLVRGSDRDYHGKVDDPRIQQFSLLRPQEIPRYVEEPVLDVAGDLLGPQQRELLDAGIVDLPVVVPVAAAHEPDVGGLEEGPPSWR